ncbi:MAG: 16S rRNA (guanine(966)-N(2))-methyltransferase RsmD [Alphaproteobacteria bacterium]|nr:16S rRNA (guanine(966)-N(2))-methyltransferase RsmD [Alphaproteobacteria bacterium]
MRIIAGTYRGKKLISAPENITRPTSDRAKEGLFNILDSWLLKSEKRWSDIIFADVFAGSGAIGLESLSRGAKQVVFFESNAIAVRFLKTNLKQMTGQVQLYSDALKPMTGCQPVDILFMDPPYHQQLIEKALPLFLQNGYIGSNTLVVCETDKTETIIYPDLFSVIRTINYGRNRFDFVQLKDNV